MYEMQTNPEYFWRYVQASLDTAGGEALNTTHRDIDADVRSEVLWYTLNEHVKELAELHVGLPNRTEPNGICTPDQQFSRKVREGEVLAVELREMQMERYDKSQQQRISNWKSIWSLMMSSRTIQGYITQVSIRRDDMGEPIGLVLVWLR